MISALKKLVMSLILTTKSCKLLNTKHLLRSDPGQTGANVRGAQLAEHADLDVLKNFLGGTDTGDGGTFHETLPLVK